jgi:hypothetical protein
MMNAGSHFGEAKKSKCPVGTRRMVKATLKASHKAQIPFSGCLDIKIIHISAGNFSFVFMQD